MIGWGPIQVSTTELNQRGVIRFNLHQFRPSTPRPAPFRLLREGLVFSILFCPSHCSSPLDHWNQSNSTYPPRLLEFLVVGRVGDRGWGGGGWGLGEGGTLCDQHLELTLCRTYRPGAAPTNENWRTCLRLYIFSIAGARCCHSLQLWTLRGQKQFR